MNKWLGRRQEGPPLLAEQRPGVRGGCRALCRRPSEASSVFRKLQLCRAGGRGASPRLPSAAGAPRAAELGLAARRSADPARKSARQEKNSRRKMSRGRKRGKKKNHKPAHNKPALARHSWREGRSRPVRGGLAGSLAAAPALRWRRREPVGAGARRGETWWCPGAGKRSGAAQAALPTTPGQSPGAFTKEMRLGPCVAGGEGGAGGGPVLPRSRAAVSVPRSSRELCPRPAASGAGNAARMLGVWESDLGAQRNVLQKGVLSAGEHKSIHMPWGISAWIARATSQVPWTAKSWMPHGAIPALLTPLIRRFSTQSHMTRKL